MDSLNKKTYIVAVSGGVDSVALLHMLVSKNSAATSVHTPHSTPLFVVAHFDHGIRPDSAADAEFVRKLAEQYGLKFECERAELGEGVSEEVARVHRYRFLRATKDKYHAEAIVTAHHQDDVLETMVIGLLRKSGVRSVVGYSAGDVLRPFLNKPKSQIMEYAKEHNLNWREDSTNEDDVYLRNYVRKHVMPVLYPVRKELLALRDHIKATLAERDVLAKHLLVQMTKDGRLDRLAFLPLPYVVQKEVVAQWLRLNGIEVSPSMIMRATLAVKLLKPGKKLELTKNATIYSLKTSVLLKVETDSV